MEPIPQIEEGQFEDAPEGLDLRLGRAYIDTVGDSGDDLDLDEDDSLDDEEEFYDQNRVEDEDWEVAERDFTKQYNRLRQHVAVRTGNAQGKASATLQSTIVASLPAVNHPRSATAQAQAPLNSTTILKDPTTDQLAAYAKKFTSRLVKIDTPYTTVMGVGVNRKGPSAHANLKDKSDRATNEQVLDPRTRLILFKMIGRDLIEEVNGCVSTGKEANVYHALTPIHTHLALKIYKTSILVFKDRSKYVTGEYRFRRGYSRNPRKMVRLWAEKEMRNLKRLRAAGIECPEPIEVRENVLVMTFIGEEGWASPRLKDASLTPEELTPLYSSLLLTIRLMFHTCHLVHADLSEYNILYHARQLCIIDVSQSVEHDHPSAYNFLRSDIRNVEEFFGRGGVKCLGIRKCFDFVTRERLAEHGNESEEEVLERWLEESQTADEEEGKVGDEDSSNIDWSRKQEEDAAHEDSVFLHSFIPRTLNEVYDPERDVEKLSRGEGKGLIYADTIGLVTPMQTATSGLPSSDDITSKQTNRENSVAEGENEITNANGGAHEEGNEVASGDDDDEDDDEVYQGEEEGDLPKEGFIDRKPRGHRHEDRDEKKERKKAVKAEAKEKRKQKMPKGEKRRIIKKSKA